MGMLTNMLRYKIIGRIPIVGDALNLGIDLANNYLSKDAREARKMRKEEKRAEKIQKRDGVVEQPEQPVMSESDAVVNMMKMQMMQQPIQQAPQEFAQSVHFADTQKGGHNINGK